MGKIGSVGTEMRGGKRHQGFDRRRTVVGGGAAAKGAAAPPLSDTRPLASREPSLESPAHRVYERGYDQQHKPDIDAVPDQRGESR